MREYLTPTSPPDQMVGGGGDQNIPGQASNQVQGRNDGAPGAVAKSPVQNAPVGATPGPVQPPERAPTIQGQVSQHDTPHTSARLPNGTHLGGEADSETKRATVPEGNGSISTPLIGLEQQQKERNLFTKQQRTFPPSGGPSLRNRKQE